MLDGVVLAYDVNSLDKRAKILPGVHPYFGVRLTLNLLLFSPKPDMLLGTLLLLLTLCNFLVIWLCCSMKSINEVRFYLIYVFICCFHLQFSVLITKMPPCFRSVSCFQDCVKQRVKTRESHFLFSLFLSQNLENRKTENGEQKPNWPLLYLHFLLCYVLFLSEGKVVKLAQESIHVVVLGFSSAIITEKDIREELVYKTVSASQKCIIVAIH